jgi:hypothetical protein
MVVQPDIEIDEKIAYFIGVLHSDGCLYEFYDKKRNRKQIRLNLTISKRSLPMAVKFKEILAEKLNRKLNIRKKPCDGSFCMQTSVNRLAPIFKEWMKEELNNEISERIELFGAYLAGLIDGDGHIKIKHIKGRKMPQCLIRIAEDHPLQNVQNLLTKFFNCKTHFVKHKTSNCVETCFLVSRINKDLFYKYVYPHLTLEHKIMRLDEFRKKTSVAGFEPTTYRSEADRSIRTEPHAH